MTSEMFMAEKQAIWKLRKYGKLIRAIVEALCIGRIHWCTNNQTLNRLAKENNSS